MHEFKRVEIHRLEEVSSCHHHLQFHSQSCHQLQLYSRHQHHHCDHLYYSHRHQITIGNLAQQFFWDFPSNG